MTTLPVLIFAQSGRFIAKSAAQNGHPVWVADCYCDQDTLAVAERFYQLTELASLSTEQLIAILVKMTQGEKCLFVYGTGIELFPSILDNLPPNFVLSGNNRATLNLIKQPEHFFELLSSANIAFPSSQFSPPKLDEQNKWLVKSAVGFGGGHIHYYGSDSPIKKHDYFQKHISGQAFSALFLANGEEALLLTINQQYQDKSAFQFTQITTPTKIDERHQQQLVSIIKKLTVIAKLRGLNSIDFIMCTKTDSLLLLEVNPRVSASAELLPSAALAFSWHMGACSGILPEINREALQQHKLLAYYFAKQDLVIPHDMVWNKSCHDRPRSGSKINKNDPVCSIKLTADSDKQLQLKLASIKQELDGKLLTKKY